MKLSKLLLHAISIQQNLTKSLRNFYPLSQSQQKHAGILLNIVKYFKYLFLLLCIEVGWKLHTQITLIFATLPKMKITIF